jgi:hypothetical protein
MKTDVSTQGFDFVREIIGDILLGAPDNRDITSRACKFQTDHPANPASCAENDSCPSRKITHTKLLCVIFRHHDYEF